MKYEIPKYNFALRMLNEYVEELKNDEPIKDENLEIKRKETVKDIAKTLIELTVKIELMERARELIKAGGLK